MKESEPTISDAGSLDPLDRLLTASLRNRPEAQPVTDLAQRAIARAKVLDRLATEHRRSLVVHRWRMRIVYGAAAVLIGLLICLGGNRLLTERRSMENFRSDDSTSSVTDSVTPTTSTYVLWLGGLLFICTLAGLAAENAIASDRPALVV
jgi:hypothetical protein